MWHDETILQKYKLGNKVIDSVKLFFLIIQSIFSHFKI